MRRIKDLAYTAGIIDGEGCIRLRRVLGKGRKKPYFGVSVEVSNTNEWLTKWLQFNFGGGVFKKKPYKLNARDAWTWRVVTKEAATFLEAVLPYLKLKRPQAELALLFSKTRKAHDKKWRDEKQIAVEQAQAILMHKYNKRGAEK